MIFFKNSVNQNDASIYKIRKFGCYMYVAAYYTLVRVSVSELPTIHSLVESAYLNCKAVDYDCYVNSIGELVNYYISQLSNNKFILTKYVRDYETQRGSLNPIIKIGKGKLNELAKSESEYKYTHFVYYDGITFFDPLGKSLDYYLNNGWSVIYTSNWDLISV